MTNSTLTMQYPSIPTSYYATGAWKHNLIKANCRFEVLSSSKVINHGIAPDPKHVLILFQSNFSQNDTLIPSKEIKAYWIQAPLAEPCISRLPNITCNSGKFLIFFPVGWNRDSLWVEFKKVYAAGNLGYAIQCSTARPSPNQDREQNNGVITVHMEDSFNLPVIAKVAHKIFETIYMAWPNYPGGVVQYMTDRSTKAKTKHCGPETAMLYSISSRTYLRNPFDASDKTARTFQDFESRFLYKFTPLAQARQDLLKDKAQHRELSIVDVTDETEPCKKQDELPLLALNNQQGAPPFPLAIYYPGYF